MQYIRSYRRAIVIATGLLFGVMGISPTFAAGTPVGTPVDNDVTMAYTVNFINQTTTTTTQFVVDEKLILDVTTLDGDWVTVVVGQSAGVGSGVPAMNFRISNIGNAATDVCVGLANQGLTQVTGFNPLGASLLTPAAVVIATDDNNNQAIDVTDTVLTPTNGVYDLGAIPADGFVDLVVSVDVAGGAGADEYTAYTLVAGLGSIATPVDRDQSGNIALAYNISSATTFPGLRYTGRQKNDSLGVMTAAETTLVAGTSHSATNRYGDYAAMGLDPEDAAGKDDFTTRNQLYLPVNKKVIVFLSSKDVVHSFSLPEFRVKQDAIPGMTIPLHFTPTMTTAALASSAVRSLTRCSSCS